MASSWGRKGGTGVDFTGVGVILACLALGLAMRWKAGLPAGAHRPLNLFVLWVPLPALILAKLPPLLKDTATLKGAWVPISMGWLQFGLAILLVGALAKWRGWTPQQEGALALTVGLGNTSFVGFPLLAAWMGPESIPIGVLVDQPGSFLILATWGVIAAGAYAGESVGLKTAWRKATTFPPLQAFALAGLVALSPWPLPSSVVRGLEAMAASLVPVALVAVGMQLAVKAEAFQRQAPRLATGLGLKLGLIPALAALFYLGLLGQRGLAAEVTVAEAAMAPMITAAVVAEEAGLDGELASLMVVVGIALSLVTVPLWMWGLGFLHP